jgi:DNA (cytosine-5)-methyltransferase 1
MNVIKSKVRRFKMGGKLRVLDLFSGCGGLSLGFQKAGYEIVASIELDNHAAASHAANFHAEKFTIHNKARDIQQTDPASFFRELGLAGNTREQIDVVIGGPPCQAFTRIGRAKLREIKSDLNAFLNDPRSQLYKSYLEYVSALKPLVILMENVPDILNYGGVNIADKICDDLVGFGYDCKYTLLNSVFYGIPQMRERMFLVAIHKDLKSKIIFPTPTHTTELPKGYHGSRNVALKNILSHEIHSYYTPPPQSEKNLPDAITVHTALEDLPEIKDHLLGLLTKGKSKINELKPYKLKEPKNEYQHLMRFWPSFETKQLVGANVIRYLPRDYPIFREMNPGDQYPQALEKANQILLRKIKRLEKKNMTLSTESAKYKQLKKQTIPPYDVSKFPNKWRKMESDKPGRTLMAHLGKDSYSHIHYDSNQARTISVREAARLQSFPDGFVFSGSMNSAFRQIGNAVPPIIAERLAMSIKESLALLENNSK